MTGKVAIDTGEAFWTFSVGLYAREGVEDEFLALQDRDGLEVNLALFCLFAGRQGYHLDHAAVQAMRALGLAWGRQVVAPLRDARRSMKANAQADKTIAGLRNEVKALELAAEKAMQMALADLLVTLDACRVVNADIEGGAKALAAQNFAAWFAAEGVDGDALRHSVAKLLDLTFAT